MEPPSDCGRFLIRNGAWLWKELKECLFSFVINRYILISESRIISCIFKPD
jgi:hypothetical protein